MGLLFAAARCFWHLIEQPQARLRTSKLVLNGIFTTGAALIYATRDLWATSAGDVTCLAIVKSIDDVL